MSILLDTLQEASFKGAKFLYSSQTEQGGRKNVVFELPNQDTRYIQDLGRMPRTFNIVGIINSVSFDYYTQRTALLNKLNDQGSGLLVHPYEGQIQVFCTSYSMDEKLSALNTITFTMTFMETGDAVFPLSATSFASTIEGKFDNLISALSQEINKAWKFSSGFLNNFNQSKDLLSGLLDNFENIPNLLSSLGESYFDFVKSTTDFSTNINKNVFDATALSTGVNDLFDKAGALSTDPEQQYIISQTFFSFVGADPITQTTVGLEERELNRVIFQQYINAQALLYAYGFTTQTTFATEADIKQRGDELNDQFAVIVLNNIYTDISGTKTKLLDADTASQLEDVRSEAHAYLRDQDATTQTIVEVFIPRNSLLPLTYQYYGSLDLQETLYDLNNLNSPTNIKGEFKIIEQSTTDEF